METPLRSFAERIQALESGRSGNSSYEGEFESLLSIDYDAAADPSLFSVGSAVENISRNRYCNVLANDASRVCLDQEQQDYINANHVPAASELDPPYIATQAPLPETFGHFWQMVYDARTSVIVMLTREVESRSFVRKCDCYWPQTGASARHGDVTVCGVSEARRGNSILERVFDVSRSGSTVLRVWHLQYVDWPDQGVPRSPEGILDLRERVARASTVRPRASIVVHCSAGVGRTGTYIGVDQTLRRVQNAAGNEGKRRGSGQDLDDIFNCVRCLKEARSKMVQTWEQYKFIFCAVRVGMQSLSK